MIKLAANAALMTRISFINEIANVCEATGADVVRVAEGIGLDRRIGPSFLRAGIGYGGSCFPKDSLALKQLAANSGYHFQLLAAVIEVNELQKRRVLAKLERHLDWRSRQDGRAARSRLQAQHRRHARGAVARPRRTLALRRRDRRAPGTPSPRPQDLGGVEQVDSIEAALAGADAAVVVTEWPQLAVADWAALAPTMRTPVLIDGRNMLDPAEMHAAGFRYEAIGRAAPGTGGA